MEVLFFIAGVLKGLVIAYLFMNRRHLLVRKQLDYQIQQLEREKLSTLLEKDSRIAALEERLSLTTKENEKILVEVVQLRREIDIKNSSLSRMEETEKHLNEKLETQKKDLATLQEKFTMEFENLANKIFRQHSQEFVQTSGKNLNELINPLKERLQTFEKKVQDVYDVERHDKISLKQEVKNLFELNRKLSEDAENLTRALKADPQKQGHWGEIVLERVLERSGLTKGAEYEMQLSMHNDDGITIRPDVVIRLPENKHLIIDSKVSLVAYENFIRCEDPDEKDKFINQHVASIRNHIKGLSEKNYQSAGLFDSPDFVLLFLPVEPAFSAGLQKDPDLFAYAWERKIVLVSPTTLLATLKTVSSIWKQEKQTQNALEIARQGGSLYDKFVSFLQDLEKLGNQINTTQKTYEELTRKLQTGNGNLIGRAEKLRKLGVKTGKVLPSQFLINEADDDEESATA